MVCLLRKLPIGIALFAAACAETRRPGDYAPQIQVSHGEAARIDALEGSSKTLGADEHRRCVLWRGALQGASADQHGLRGYATARADQACRAKAEDRFRTADDAIAAWLRDASLASARAAVASVDAYVESVVVEDNATVDALVSRARPAIERMQAQDATCDDGRAAAWLRWRTGGRDDARAAILGPLRSCVGAREVVALLGEARRTGANGACERAVVLAPIVWPRLSSKEEQVSLLDAVAACSDAFSMRRNLAFVPEDVLLDYRAYVLEREAREAAEDLRRETQRIASEAIDRCRDHCMTLYADQGGVCTSSCRGDTTCFRNCQTLGTDCFRQCR